jgi:hypothetical protein
LILGELVFLGRDVFGHRIGQRLLLFRLAVVRQREIQIERQRARQARQSPEGCFGFVELVFFQPGDGGACAGVTLKPTDLLNLTLCLRLGAGLEILAEALTVETSVELKNDFPGGIREL